MARTQRSLSPNIGGREAILKAARMEFAHAGFHGVTMRDIAERAKVSQGLLHHHFKSKEGLWKAVGEETSAEFLAYVSSAVAGDASDGSAIPDAIRTYLSYWREHPESFRFNLWRLLEGPTEERKLRSRQLNERAVPLFKKAQETGFLRSDMPAGFVMCVAGSLVQFWLHSQIEMRDAITIGGAAMPDDDEFIGLLTKLLSA